MPTEEKQIKNKFDAVTLRKIGKGAGITAFYAAAVFILSVVNGMDLGNSLLNALITQVVPTLINSLKEWKKGEMEEIGF